MIDPRKLYAAIAGEWDKTSQPLVERGIPGEEFNKDRGMSAYFSLPYLADKLAPVGTYEDGRVGAALPKALTDLPQFSDFVTSIPGAAAGLVGGLVNSTKRLMDSDLARTPVNDDAAWQRMGLDAFDAAGLAATGGLGVGLAGGMADDAVKAVAKPALEDMPARAAFKWGDDVFTGQYHGNAIRDAVDKYGKDAVIAYRDANGLDDLQGFQTLGGDFISRQQAAENIRRSGRAPGENVPDELHSDYLNELRAKGLWANPKTSATVPLLQNALERAQPQGIRASKELAPQDVGSYISARDYENLIRDQYVRDGQKIASSREVPFEGALPEVGAWRMDDFNGIRGREISELANVPIDRLDLPEVIDGRLDPLKRGDDERYAQWLKEGKRAPPLEVVQTEDGRLRVMDGHRRALAARLAGNDTVEAWVSPTVPIPGGPVMPNGQPLKSGLTYEMAMSGGLDDLFRSGLYSGAPTASAVPLAGETQDTDPALLEYLRSVGLY